MAVITQECFIETNETQILGVDVRTPKHFHRNVNGTLISTHHKKLDDMPQR